MGRNMVDGSRTTGGKAYRQSEDFKDLVRWRDSFTCQICGYSGWDVDHIIPHSEGGLSIPENLRVLCHLCNCLTKKPQRNARLPLDKYYEALEAELNA